MGFCRRCGEIVNAERCSRCGGSPAAPLASVAFRKTLSDNSAQDKWSRTYISTSRPSVSTQSTSVQSSIATLNRNADASSNPPSPTKRFPRPVQSAGTGSRPLSNRVSQYIASTTSTRPRSPLKQTATLPDPASDIIPSLVDNTLSKVYGSVLQPKETLSSYSCSLCASPFPPDATIYPDPSQLNPSNPRFLCRPCYEGNGGSKGLCGACTRPVLTLKAEGGFVQAAGKYWHKRCFDCTGCFKNIGDNPMVDLLGRPCCVNCFDNCLKRDTPKKKQHQSPGKGVSSSYDSPKRDSSNVGGLSKAPQGLKIRESSPAIEELEQRLGITRINDSASPRQSLNASSPSPLGKRPTSRTSYSNELANGSPSRQSPTRRMVISSNSLAPGSDALQEMTQRMVKLSSAKASPSSPPASVHLGPRTRHAPSPDSTSTSVNQGRYDRALPETPDLVSDFSDTNTQSSQSDPSDSPPRSSRDEDIFRHPTNQGEPPRSWYDGEDLFNTIVEETASQLNTPTKAPASRDTTPARGLANISPLRIRKKSSPSSRPSDNQSIPSNCGRCGGGLFGVGDESTFVTLPSLEKTKPAEVFHTHCFTCSVCNGVFQSERKGQASFVRHKGRPCHSECAPKERITIHKSPSSPSLRTLLATRMEDQSPSPSPSRQRSSTHRPISSRLEPTLAPSPVDRQPAPRFGSRTVCPGCKQAVSPMERGVIPGPQGTKWHSACLICGGKKKTRPVSWYGVRRQDEAPTPGCGKKLDSAAKSDGDGGVWCRECMLLLGLAHSPQPSPVRTALSPTYTGSGKMVPQFTGAPAIPRQFTGAGGGEATLLRQLTGSGALNPTRSISPTKQLGMNANPFPGVRPRPKSVLGLRSAKSVDEGRGMFLVKQFTGSSTFGS